MQEDPAFYRRFSELLEDAIRAFREQRLSDAEYLQKVTDIASRVRNRTDDDVPDVLANREVAKAFFGVIHEIVSQSAEKLDAREFCAAASLGIDEIVNQHRIVNWTRNPDIQNRMKGAIEDYLFELKEERGVNLTFEEIDRVLESVIEIARVRYA